MTGWRIGFAVGSPDALRALNTIKGNVDSKQFAAVALTAGWALNHASNDAATALLQKRRDVLVDGLNRLGWSLEKPKATFYIWAPVPPGYTSATFSRELLEKATSSPSPASATAPTATATSACPSPSAATRTAKSWKKPSAALRRTSQSTGTDGKLNRRSHDTHHDTSHFAAD